MATSAVSAVLSKLGQLAADEAAFLLGLEDEMVHVEMNLQWLLGFLHDADQKRRDMRHPLVRVWVRQLREAAYSLEDVLDEYATDVDLQRRGLHGWKAWPWLHFFTSPKKQLFIRHDLTSQIIKINKRLDTIASNRTRYLDHIISSSDSHQESSSDMMIKQLRTEVEANPTGQDAYVEDIMSQLLDSNAQGISFISIVGMGGLGKTTLCKRIYDDGQVVSHFNHRAWLTISQTFSGIDLLRRLVKELLGFNREETMKMEETEMKSKLQEHIRGKSFIIVLDDMWDINSWKYLQSIVPKEHERIVVLLTTRNKNIATDLNPNSQVIELNHLDDEQSWRLFCKKAFSGDDCPDNLRRFKDEVVRKCKGLPLAIVVLGGVLGRRNDANYWEKVLKHISVNSKREEEELTYSILALSYDDLPRHLKPCFLYVTAYPEDCDINAEELLRMWIAEGFIQEQEDNNMEDLAEEYLEELLQRSLIQLVKRNMLGQVSIIRVHDLVLDMARKEAREIDFFHQNLPQKSRLTTRHLLLYGDGADVHGFFNCLQNHLTRKLRSLHIHMFGTIKFSAKYFSLHPKKFLRVLSLQGIEFQKGKFPKAIGNLIQLRYLSFGRSDLEKLPTNISNLENLQTLDVRYTYVEQVPEKFWEIASLRHVIGGWRLKVNPSSRQDVSKLSMLQTLTGGRANYNWIIKDGLRKLTNIRKLSLVGVYKFSGYKEENRRKIEEKVIEAIEKFEHLTWLDLREELASKRVLTVTNTALQFLRLQNNVQSLANVWSEDRQHKMLPNLHTLLLNNMGVSEDEVDVIGSLPNLKTLSIVSDTQLRKLVFKEGHFCSLQQLDLISCDELESWEVMGDVSRPTMTLRLVKIEGCPKLKKLPQELQANEIHLRESESDEIHGGGISDEVKKWVEEMAVSPTQTLVKIVFE